MRHLTAALLALAASTAFAGGNEPTVLPNRTTDLDKTLLAALDEARKAYNTRDEKARCDAVALFAAINDPAADPYLLAIAYCDSHPAVRLCAIEVLFKRENTKAGALAARLATSSCPKHYRDAGADWVKAKNDAGAIQLLIKVMAKGDAGHEATTRFSPDPGGTTWDAIIPKCLAAAALGRIATPEALEALMKTGQTDPDWELRQATARAMGDSGDPSTVPTLIRMLGDKDLDVRTECLIALYRVGGGEAKDALKGALKDRNPVYAKIAARMLQLANKPAPPPPAPPAPPPGPAPAGGTGTQAEPPPTVTRRGPPAYPVEETGTDLLYTMDTTFSMTSARDRMKLIMSQKIQGKDGADFRFGFVAYRDFSNQYLTTQLFLTRDMEKAQKAILAFTTTGGNAGAGSALDKALQVALMLPWSGQVRTINIATDVIANDMDDAKFRVKLLHEEEGVTVNVLLHTLGATRRKALKELAEIGGGEAGELPPLEPGDPALQGGPGIPNPR